MLKLFLSLLLSFTVKGAFAACSSPAGVSGIMQYISNEFKYCDGSTWKSTTVSNLGTGCSSVGFLTRSGTDLRFCNGTNWISLNGSSTGATCAAGSIGIMSWKSSDNRYEWCDGVNWRLMQPTTTFMAPSNLSLFYPATNEVFFMLDWTAGTSAGPCKIQYYKNEAVWTDLDGPFDCDVNMSAALTIPLVDDWTNNFNATGVKLRIVSTVSGDSYGEFPQRLNCIVKPNPVAPTSNIDENCNGIWNDEVVGSSSCDGTEPIGALCPDGIIFAGTIDQNTYYITPSGCTDSATPTCSGGTDTLKKAWIGSHGSTHDFAYLPTTFLTDRNNAGEGETWIITVFAALELVITDTAANYCRDLTYQGYNDWFLPSKSELSHLYCHMNVPSHSASNPQESPNCAAFGGKTSELTGFSTSGTSYYWSTSKMGMEAYRIATANGSQSTAPTTESHFIRCMRKEQGTPIAPTGLQYLQASPNSSEGRISWTAGSGTGGIGGCKVQYLKDGITWTDTVSITMFLESTDLDCDSNLSNGLVILSRTNDWTNNFNASGVSLRLVLSKTGAVLGTFSEKAVCIPMDGSSTPSPSIDENCNGKWDDNVGGTPGCPSGQECANMNMYTDNLCSQGEVQYSSNGCASSGSISAMGGMNTCISSPFVGNIKIFPANGCVEGGTFY